MVSHDRGDGGVQRAIADVIQVNIDVMRSLLSIISAKDDQTTL